MVFSPTNKIPDTVASNLVKHFAWSSNSPTEQAKVIDSYLGARSLRERCQEIVGWKPAIAPSNMADSLAAIHQLLLKQQEQTELRISILHTELIAVTNRQDKFNDAGNNHPGVKAVILNELDEKEPYDGGMTIPQWLKSQCLTVPATLRNAMSRRAAQFYRVDKQREPSKYGGNVVFYGKDLVYIELAYKSVTGTR